MFVEGAGKNSEFLLVPVLQLVVGRGHGELEKEHLQILAPWV